MRAAAYRRISCQVMRSLVSPRRLSLSQSDSTASVQVMRMHGTVHRKNSHVMCVRQRSARITTFLNPSDKMKDRLLRASVIFPI